MSYRGFTWNMTYADAAQIKRLLEYYVLRPDVPGYNIDRHQAELLVAKALIFMELSPDGTTPRSATADS